MITLKNDRLRVEIAEPGEGRNKGFRFDRAGFVTEVVLDECDYFCASEPKNLSHPCSGGRGLCCEYTADYSGETEEKEWYPKWGVGLIRKDGPYAFYKSFKELKEFPVEMQFENDRVEFTTHPLECQGYAMQINKELELCENQLLVEVSAWNVGSREIITQEYCHNFLSIDGMAISPAYFLELPVRQGIQRSVLKNAYENPGNFILGEKGISVARCETAVSLSQFPLENLEIRKPFVWKLSHQGAKMAVEGLDEIQVDGLTLWAADHMLCPEIFQKICVKPGERHTWKRSLRFISEKERKDRRMGNAAVIWN